MDQVVSIMGQPKNVADVGKKKICSTVASSPKREKNLPPEMAEGVSGMPESA
jgi:hypothetical protein